jgi:membrane-bound serine protease (ClpP class)
LIGKTAAVKEALKPEGTVFLEGECWSAISESGPVKPGEEVVITKVDGLKLYVTKKEKEGNK